MRIWQSLLLCVSMVVPGAVACGQELEQFRLKTGEEPIQAKPLSWDFQAGVLKVELANGTTRDVATNELHPADIRLVERLLSKQLLAGRKGESITGSDFRKPGSVANIGTSAANGQADRVHGVRWFDNESQARKIATGKDGSQDDKPLVWFRVLGDMTGFM